MNHQTREVIRRISIDHNDRTLEAEVTYDVTNWLEPRPYGDGVAYQDMAEFHIRNIEYLTEDLSEEDRKALNEEIEKGPYE